jgi:hypothetical protein
MCLIFLRNLSTHTFLFEHFLVEVELKLLTLLEHISLPSDLVGLMMLNIHGNSNDGASVTIVLGLHVLMCTSHIY